MQDQRPSGVEQYRQRGIVVCLDFGDEELAREAASCLRFAGIGIAGGASDATVTLGDRTHRLEEGDYVHLYIESSAAVDHPCSVPLQWEALQAALARVHSRALQALVVPDSDPVFANFVGVSDFAVKVREQMSQAAATDVTVLLEGPSGTGKDVVARLLHAGSPRSEGPFVPVNCGAIPADLLESELFGHEKGAFTGAINQKTGRFELAERGTLFLDEIGDMPLALQVKLLRAIEQKSFDRVGGTQTRTSDLRIIAATNQNLEEMVHEGTFREDLYYRLSVFPITLLPLAERTEDIPYLVNVLAEQIYTEQGLQPRVSLDALNVLARYPWPGNVRELFNLLQRLALQYPHEVVTSAAVPEKYLGVASAAGSHHVATEQAGTRGNNDPTKVMLPVNGLDLKDYLRRLEKNLIEQALVDTDSVVARAADRLHIRRTTLVEKMRKHGLGRTADNV